MVSIAKAKRAGRRLIDHKPSNRRNDRKKSRASGLVLQEEMENASERRMYRISGLSGWCASRRARFTNGGPSAPARPGVVSPISLHLSPSLFTSSPLIRTRCRVGRVRHGALRGRRHIPLHHLSRRHFMCRCCMTLYDDLKLLPRPPPCPAQRRYTTCQIKAGLHQLLEGLTGLVPSDTRRLGEGSARSE